MEADEGIQGTWCENCIGGKRWLAEADEPYHEQHYICDQCYATYNVKEKLNV